MGANPTAKIVLGNDGGTDLSKIYILVTFYDSKNTPVSFSFDIGSLKAGEERTYIKGFTLGGSAAIGTYKVEVIVLTDFLVNGGVYIPDGRGESSFQVTD